MQTLTAQSAIKTSRGKPDLPVTGRGRALYTLDWFINGKPVLNHHDNPRLSVRNGMPCC